MDITLNIRSGAPRETDLLSQTPILLELRNKLYMFETPDVVEKDENVSNSLELGVRQYYGRCLLPDVIAEDWINIKFV